MNGVLNSVRKIFGSTRVYSGIATNAISSIGNFAVSIALARSMSIGEVGEFAIAFALYVFVTDLIRAGICEPILARVPKVEMLRTSAGRVSLVSLVSGVILGTIAIIWDMPYLLVVAIGIQGLSIFDFSKTMNLAALNKNIPLMQELCWTAISVVAGILVITGQLNGFYGFVVWVISGSLIGYLSAYLQKLELRPKWQQTVKESKLSLAFSGDFLIGSGTTQIASNLVGLIAGMATVGSLRAGGTLLGPVSIIVASARSLAIPYLARGVAKSASEAVSRSIASSLIMISATAPVLILIAFIPSSIGSFVLGENWQHAGPVLPFLALEMGFIAVTTVPFAGFRALLAGRAVIIIRSILAIFRIGVVVIAAMAGGAVTVAFAMAIASGIGMIIWWVSYFVQLKRRS